MKLYSYDIDHSNNIDTDAYSGDYYVEIHIKLDELLLNQTY